MVAITVGQVQDAGLVFLSAISTSVVNIMKGSSESFNSSDIVATSLIALAACTACLGALVFLVGKLNLASVVQYLPMPVLAGYLAYIGFFCGLSSFGMMADQDVATIYDIPMLLSWKSAILIFPGVLGGMLIYISLRFLRSPLTLPLCMLVILSGFFSILFFSGSNIEEARKFGWIHPYTSPGSPLEAVSLYDFSLVSWSVFPSQITKFLAMVAVVTVSSSLDIAAIEMEMGRPVDYNQELKTVGLSNLVSGIFGGYTGSYIFSQTIFCLRRGVKTKASGLTLLLCELFVVLFPISITAYIPKMFFGSLLMLISLDLQYEWLISSRHKMMPSEYIVSILTYLCIQVWGIESGMIIGILAATLSFVGLYSQLEVVSISAQRMSNAQRTFEERLMLISHHRKVVTMSFRGYIFFGSAANLLPVLKSYLENVVIPGPETAIDMNAVAVASIEEPPVCYSSGSGRPILTRNSNSVSDGCNNDYITYLSPTRRKHNYHSPEKSPLLNSENSSPEYGTKDRNSSPGKVLQDISANRKFSCGSAGSDLESRLMGEVNKTEFVVFDFTDTHGVDATASRNCFALVMSLLRGYTDITLVFTGLSSSIEMLFRSHGIILEGDLVVGSLNDGLEWCEEELLKRLAFS